ncbi:MAG: c-type cytochrome [Campylobacterota bacterium]|nr:c-type cytochrome [Campylobacterota bacterium]
MLLLKNSLFVSLALLLFSGCSETKNLSNLDGEVLLQQKCMSCHDLHMPAKTSPDEIAPPMMAVAFHIKSNMQSITPAETKAKYVAFLKDYVMQPSLEKTFCDAESLKKYGLMPAQKGNLTLDELEAIALYMFEHYDQTKFLNMLQQQSDLNALPKGEQLARKHSCLSCHNPSIKKVGPSLKAIALKHSDATRIMSSIKNGSRGNWKGFKATMPPNSKLTKEELFLLSEWILTH